MEMEARACTGEISGSGEGEGEGEGERERERERNSSGRDTIPEEPSFKSDLLQHYNLRGLYDNAICVDKEPPRKVGKASYFEYSTIAGDGHLRSDPDESNKYDLAPMGEVRQSMQEVKLRPFSTKDIRNAFPLKPGHFELPKVRCLCICMWRGSLSHSHSHKNKQTNTFFRLSHSLSLIFFFDLFQ